MSTGKVVNLMASDATRLHFSIAFFHWLPSSILQLFVAMFVLYSVVGMWPLVSAMATMVLSLPLSYWASKQRKILNDKLMERRDLRVGRTNELLSAIKLVKSNAWEDGFRARVQQSRLSELSMLFKYLMASAMFGVLWEGLGYVMTMAAFTAYSYTDELAADVAFTALALFEILRMPMIMMPNIVGSMVTAHTAVER
eukprot:SAG31_NODE_8633_length_1417_cov_1.088012_1_plen_197_part_00